MVDKHQTNQFKTFVNKKGAKHNFLRTLKLNNPFGLGGDFLRLLDKQQKIIVQRHEK